MNTTTNTERTDNIGNDDTGQYYENLETSPNIVNAIIAINSVFALCGCVGNILAAFVLARGNKRKRHSIHHQNLFLMNLAIADIGVLVFAFPVWAIKLKLKWPFGEFLCKFLSGLAGLFHAVSLASMVAIAIVRYRTIVHSRENNWTLKGLRLIILAIWLLCFVTAALPAIFSQTFWEQKFLPRNESLTDNNTISSTKVSQMCGQNENDPFVAFDTIATFLLWYVGPLLVIFLTVIRIHVFFQKQMNDSLLSQASSRTTIESRYHKLRRALLMLAMVAASFAILLFPWNLIKLILLTKQLREIYEQIAATMLVLNSCVNPIIYYLMSVEFRLELRRQFMCVKKHMRGSLKVMRGDKANFDTTLSVSRRVESLKWNDYDNGGMSLIYETLRKNSMMGCLDKYDVKEIVVILKEQRNLKETLL